MKRMLLQPQLLRLVIFSLTFAPNFLFFGPTFLFFGWNILFFASDIFFHRFPRWKRRSASTDLFAADQWSHDAHVGFFGFFEDSLPDNLVLRTA